MYVKRLILIIILSLISSVSFAGSLEKAQKIASLIVTEQQYVAIMASRKDEIAERVKAALAGKVDGVLVDTSYTMTDTHDLVIITAKKETSVVSS